MKPSKEAILGVLAAMEERRQLDPESWRAEQAHKVESFLLQANRIPGIHASALPDPAGMPFARVRLQVEPQVPGLDAPALARALKAGQPSIWTMENLLAEGALLLELVPLTGKELQIILERIAAAMSGGTH